ncbi:MAG: hypothetical protein PHH11_04575 [Methylomonas sp.]|nr:hypothetical protein [Methylomonas sp.]
MNYLLDTNVVSELGKPETPKPVGDILADIAKLDEQIKALEAGLVL